MLRQVAHGQVIYPLSVSHTYYCVPFVRRGVYCMRRRGDRSLYGWRRLGVTLAPADESARGSYSYYSCPGFPMIQRHTVVLRNVAHGDVYDIVAAGVGPRETDPRPARTRHRLSLRLGNLGMLRSVNSDSQGNTFS